MIFSFKGLMAPVLTPFANNSKQSLVLQAIPDYARYLVTVQGVKGVLVNGTSGEGMSMTIIERRAVVEAWVQAAKDLDLTIMVQVGGAVLKDVKAMAMHAENLGVSALLCLPDLFNKPTDLDDLVFYMQQVSEVAPKTPLLYYHMPLYTNVSLNMPKFFALAAEKVPTFVGAKYNHANMFEATAALAAANRLNLCLFFGCDTVMVGAFTLGFESAIVTTLNMFAEPSHMMLAEIKAGNANHARLQQQRLVEVINIISKNGSWVATMKEAMNCTTPIQVGQPRPPLHPITPEQVEKMRQDLSEFGLSKN